jgi:hypothetical protein
MALLALTKIYLIDNMSFCIFQKLKMRVTEVFDNLSQKVGLATFRKRLLITSAYSGNISG